MKKLIYAALVCMVLALAGCSGNDKIPHVTITGADHMSVVKLPKGSPMVLVRVRAVAEQELPPLKSNDDYDVVHMTKVIIEDRNGRWTNKYPGIEVYLQMKQTCVVQFNFKDDKGNPRFLYVRVEVPEQPKPVPAKPLFPPDPGL